MVIVKEIIRSYYTCSDTVKLDIDVTIEKLTEQGMLDERELIVLYLTKEQYTKADIEEVIGIPSTTVGRVLNSACEKISKHLGPEYQDEKILCMVEERLGRSLTKQETSFCLFKMRNFRHDGMQSLSIFNFGVKNGKFIKRGKDKAEG